MGEATQEQLNNPLHGVKQKEILEYLEAHLGWEEMGRITNINCFKNRPTLTSSLRFIRKTEWARLKVQQLYLDFIQPDFDPSVDLLWENLVAANSAYEGKGFVDAFHFSNMAKEANLALEKVLSGEKTASFASAWWFENSDEDLPEMGNCYVICNWDGIAKAIIETTEVIQIPFSDLAAEHAALEGESDRNLEEWKAAHWNFFEKELEETGKDAEKDLLVIIEKFKLIYPV